jgi:hypothetical protein
MGYDVFISYSAGDKMAADAICAKLESARVRCWIAPRDIRPGMTWGSAIIGAIDGARMMLLLFSRHANASQQVTREVERAVHKELVIIPVRIEDVQPAGDLEYFLGTPHWLDAMTLPLERHLDRIVDSVKFWLEREEAIPRGGRIRSPSYHQTEGPAGQRDYSSPGERLSWFNSHRAATGTLVVLAGVSAYLVLKHSPVHASHPIQPLITSAGPIDPALSCDKESALSSQIGADPVSLTFTNRAEGPRKIYWLNYSGKRVLYMTIDTGQSGSLETYPTHPWVITDSSGECVAIFLAGPNGSQAIIDH